MKGYVKSLRDYERELEAPLLLLIKTRNTYDQRIKLLKKIIDCNDCEASGQIESLIARPIHKMIEKYGKIATMDMVEYFMSKQELKIYMEHVEVNKRGEIQMRYNEQFNEQFEDDCNEW